MDAAVEKAVTTLGLRARSLRNRAMRAPRGSNQHQRCVQHAVFMASAAQRLASDESLQAELKRRGVLDGGWRQLAHAISDEMRKRAEKR